MKQLNILNLSRILSGKFGLKGLKTLIELDIYTGLSTARRHRISSLLADKLANEARVELPLNIEIDISGMLTSQLERSFDQTAQYCELKTALDEAGIDFLVLKGFAVAMRYYPKPWLRESNDIDLMVRASDLEAATGALEKLGYQRTRPNFSVTSQNLSMIRYKMSGMDFQSSSGSTVEMHWRCIQNAELLDWTYEDVEESLSTFEMANTNFNALRSDYQLIYLCCHGAKHGWLRFKWLYDIHMMLLVLTEDELKSAYKIAGNHGLRIAFRSAILLHDRFFDGDYGASFDDADWRHTNFVVELAARYLSEPELKNVSRGYAIQNSWRKVRFVTLLKTGLKFKLTVIGRTLFSNKDVKALNLSVAWLPLYWILGPLLYICRVIARVLS
ncbi:MAG: nucleotidyltransferase domain-containing protein [Rhizobiaceae bacterium]